MFRARFALSALAALPLAALGAGCAAGSGAGAEAPQSDDEHAERVEALEASLARLEERQLDHIQRQRELERSLEELTAALRGDAGAEDARGEPRRRPMPPGAPSAPGRPGGADAPSGPPSAGDDEVHAVPVGDAPTAGPDDAPVTLIHAFEFACPFCHRARPTLEELREEYGDDLRIAYKNFIVHPDEATTPALAACAAHEQGAHAEMEALIWERGFEADRDFSAENMESIARDLDLDMDRFEADMEGEACRTRLREDQAEMQAFGARGTPTSFVNGRLIPGAQPAAAFRAIIDEELEKARARIDEEGTDPGDYYDTWVLDEGEPPQR